MLNPLLETHENQLQAQIDEIRFGLYEIESFRGKYLNIKSLLESANEKLEKPSERQPRLALVGVIKATTKLRARLNKSERQPLLDRDTDNEDEEAEQQLLGGEGDVEVKAADEVSTENNKKKKKKKKKGLPQKWYSAVSSPRSSPPIATLMSTSTLGASSNPTLATLGSEEALAPSEGGGFQQDFLNEIERVELERKEAVAKCMEMMQLAKEALAQANQSTSAVQRNALRIELKDIYQNLHQISQYVSANHTMATRSLYAKPVMNSRYGPRIRSELQETTREMFEPKQRELEMLIQRVESLFGRYFGIGDDEAAHFELLAYLTARKHEIEAPLAGLLGFAIASVVFALGLIFFSPLELHLLEKEGLDRIYRGLSAISLLPWAHSIVIYLLRKNRINYVLLFEMDPKARQYHDLRRTAYRACASTIIIVSNLIACLIFINKKQRFLACACPAVLLPVYLTGIYQSPIMSRLTALPWKDILLNLVGLSPLTFAVVFRTDLMTSLAKPMGDMARLLCHIIYLDEWANGLVEERTCETSFALNQVIIPALAIYPLWLRIIQNLHQSYVTRKTWPFFFNAMKYALAQQVVIISTLRSNHIGTSQLFQAIFVASSLITNLWDVFMDFGLGRPQFGLLRDRLMFKWKSFYYISMIMDLFLRFTWTLTLVSSGYVKDQNRLLLIPLGPNVPMNLVEISRRTMWSLLRIENEHLNNTLHYRDVDFVPLYFYEDEEADEKKQVEQAFKQQDTKLFLAAMLRVVLTLVGVVAVATWTLKHY